MIGRILAAARAMLPSADGLGRLTSLPMSRDERQFREAWAEAERKAADPNHRKPVIFPRRDYFG